MEIPVYQNLELQYSEKKGMINYGRKKFKSIQFRENIF